MTTIERLRALEKKWHEEVTVLRDMEGSCDHEGAIAVRAAAAQAESYVYQLESLIAELGQEVGAVALIEAARDWIAKAPHGDNCYLDPDHAYGNSCYCGKESIMSMLESPAHTSEARDAARLDWLDSNGFTAYRAIDPIDGLSGHCVVVHETQRPRRGNVHDTIRGAIDAAMGEAK